MGAEAPPIVDTEPESKPASTGSTIDDVDSVLKDTVGRGGSIVTTAVAGGGLGLVIGDVGGFVVGALLGALVGAVGLRGRSS
ncbi:MAG TPA: hypothetical protein VG147_05905 [Solirubrobacteraceae bacterium]|jgi:hypothetical protein|nr:hypothetical protein [Solirubrobacteraceae bacterium]